MRKLLLLLLLLDLFHSISFIFYLLVSVVSMPLCTGKWPFHPLRTLSFETVMELDNCTSSMPSNCIKYNSCWNVTHHNASYRHRIVFCWYYLLICYCYASFLVVLWGHGQTDGRTYARMYGIVGPGGIICEMKFFLALCQWRWRRDVVFDGIVWGPLEFNEWMFCAIHPSVRPPAIRLVWPLELEGSGKTELTSASTIATDGVKRLRVSLRLDECWLSKVSRFICIPHHVHIKFKE